jgi:hypothetical protein
MVDCKEIWAKYGEFIDPSISLIIIIIKNDKCCHFIGVDMAH